MKLTHVITKFFLAVLAGLAFAVTAQAMTVEVHGNQIFATGRVDGDDFGRFETALSTAGVDTVVFVNSPGGDLRNGLRIARLIVAKGLNTVAAGYCISSCAIMFMGGKQRSFSDVLRPLGTYIGIHGAHNRSTKEVNPLP